MNPEYSFSERLYPWNSQDPMTALHISPSTQVNVGYDLNNLLDFDSNEVAFAKAATLLRGEESDDAPGITDNTDLAAEPLKYVQGMVQGERVYLVTNLLGDESETLLQPQMVWTIGRNREAALPIKDRLMSRRHAVLLYVRHVGFHLIDLNSMNGSFVNGTRIQQRQRLNDGDRIRVGNTNFSFFVSSVCRSLGAIHPEVLSRFTASGSRSNQFMDYSALEEPEILFNIRQ
jgi:hypothetical protein